MSWSDKDRLQFINLLANEMLTAEDFDLPNFMFNIERIDYLSGSSSDFLEANEDKYGLRLVQNDD